MALIVGYDRHPASRAALRFAAELAGALNVALHVVHVADVADTSINAPPTAPADQRQRGIDPTQIAALLPAGSQWSYHLMDGDPVAALIEAASEHAASMIVVGRPEQGFSAAIGHIVSGAVARNLIRRSPRPVVMVPAAANGGL